MQQTPNQFHGSEWERGLWWMVLLSAAIHIGAIAFIILSPSSLFLSPPEKVVSYTVDLVAPDRVGGTNLVEGGKGRIQAAPMVAAVPKQEAPPPPPPPPPEKPKEVAAVKPPPPPVPAKIEPKEAPDKNAFVDKQKLEAQAVPTVTAVPTKVIAKVEPPKPTVPSKAQLEAAAKKATEEAKAKKAAEEAAKKLADEAKKKAADEAALKKAAEEAAKKAAAETAAKAAAEKARDDQILAAVKRASDSQVGERGGGTGNKVGAAPGGPISVGPGEGAGGQPMGLDFILYYGQLEKRLKDAWAWAGPEDLEAVVHFVIQEGGDVVDVRITKSSGDRSFDASVERAVRAINPMPPPPAEYRSQFEDVTYTFNQKKMQK